MASRIAEKLPKSVRIGPYDLDLRVVEKMEGDDDWGSFIAHQGIEVRAEQPNDIFALDTVLHEVMHAIYEGALLEAGDKEERVVAAMASGMVQVVRDNPDLVKWMIKAAKCYTESTA